MTAESRRRVKLYSLNDDRLWDDQGTGHVASSYDDELNITSLSVRSEIDGTTLTDHLVFYT